MLRTEEDLPNNKGEGWHNIINKIYLDIRMLGIVIKAKMKLEKTHRHMYRDDFSSRANV